MKSQALCPVSCLRFPPLTRFSWIFLPVTRAVPPLTPALAPKMLELSRCNDDGRGVREPEYASYRAPKVVPFTIGDSRLRQRPGWTGEGVSGVCHGPEHLCRWHAFGGSSLSAFLHAGFAGDSKRSIGCLCDAAQGRAQPAGQGFAHATRRRLQPGGSEVFPATGEFPSPTQSDATEAGFCGVKIFSLLQPHLSCALLLH